MSILIKIFIIWSAIFSISFASEINIFDFTNEELAKLDVRKVRGADNKTIYTVGSNESSKIGRAHV